MLSNVIFKLVNLFALLGYLFNIISMFTSWNNDASDIVNGIFHIFSFLALLYIEVDQRPAIANVVPFLFSFVGRGFFYMWLSWSTFRIDILSIIGTIFTFIVGVIYVFLFILKHFKPPQHMSYDDALFAGVSKFLNGEEGELFLPTHKRTEDSTSTNQQRENAYTPMV